jgi:Arc/MetJ family transcription regulator
MYIISKNVHTGELMRTNIDIDEKLMADALKLGGFKTKREAIEAALKMFVRTRSQESIRKLRGKIKWEGDLDAMRRD